MQPQSGTDAWCSVLCTHVLSKHIGHLGLPLEEKRRFKHGCNNGGHLSIHYRCNDCSVILNIDFLTFQQTGQE